MLEKQQKRHRRHKRAKAKIFGTAKKPRLCVFRSSKHIYAQIIDDEKNQVLVSASDLNLKAKGKNSAFAKATVATADKQKSKIKVKEKIKKEKSLTGKTTIAHEVGQLIAKKGLEKGIKKVAFDRGGYKYHGRVKALAEGAREGGLNF